jgi:type I restriction enzyme S subunit
MELMTKQGYKQTEVGLIPEDWEVQTLAESVEFLDGKRRPIKSNERISGDYPYYGASGIIDYVKDYIFDDDLILLGEDGENILSRNSPLAFIVRGKAWVNNHAHVMKPNKNFDIYYLTEFLESLDYTLLNSGTAQPKLNKQSCLNIRVPRPTLTEQKAIATALSDVDALIASLEQTITKKKAIKQGAMQQLLTGRTRIKGFEGTGQFRQTEVGLIPEDWGLVSFDEIFTFYSTSNYSKAEMSEDDEVGCIHYGLIHAISNTRYNLNEGIRYYVNSEQAKYALVRDGDVIMVDASEDLEGVNKSVEVFGIGNKKYISGLHTYLLRDKKESLADNFRGIILNSSAVKNQMLQLAVGMKVYGVSKTQLIKVKLPLPTLTEQKAIAQILSDMDTEITKFESKKAKHQAIKQGMMQELLTGKTRLEWN